MLEICDICNNMIFFFWFVVFGSIVYTQTLNPRSVNVALETVVEFDGKHNNQDVKAIDRLQNYLNQIKQILTNTNDGRRRIVQKLNFSDFLKSSLRTIASYDDDDLLHVVTILNKEIRKYHYKGCRFHELIENLNMRRDMAEKLIDLNDLTAKQLRTKINKAADALEFDLLDEQEKEMLDYLDSVYDGNKIKNKMKNLLLQLEQFKRRSKRSDLNLTKVINQGMRNILFDYYTNLIANARKELKVKVEKIWQNFINGKSDKDVWREVTTEAFNYSVSNIETVQSKPKLRNKLNVKKAKRKKIYLKPLLNVTVNKLHAKNITLPLRSGKKGKRSKVKGLKKVNPKSLHRKKTNRLKKYENQDLRTLQALAKTIDSSEYRKSKIRLAKIRKKQRKAKHQRDHQYVQNSQRSNDYEATSEEGLHIQSFEIKKYADSLRKSFTDRLNDTKHNITETTVIPNVMYKIEKIEKVLDEIKSLVSLRKNTLETNDNSSELVKETTTKPSSTTTSIKETVSTFSTPQTTKMSSMTTESTSSRIIVQHSKINKTQTSNAIETQETDKMDAQILSVTKMTYSTPKKKAESTSTIKKLESTVKTTLSLNFITTNGRRSNVGNFTDNRRSLTETKTENTSKTKHSNNDFNSMVKNKLKSIKERELNDLQRERNQYHTNDSLRNINNKITIEKDHEFPDVIRSKKHNASNSLEDFINGKTNIEKEKEWSDMDIHSAKDFKNSTKEHMNFGKDHSISDLEHLSKHNENDDFDEFIQENRKFLKNSESTGVKYISKDGNKAFTPDKTGFKKEKGSYTTKHHNTHMQSNNKLRKLSKDKMKINEEKQTDVDIDRIIDSHRNMETEDDKDIGGSTDLEVERMYNETRLAHLDKILDKNSARDRELNVKVREKIAGHMRTLMGMKGRPQRKFNLDIDDPFNIKDDDLML